MTKVLYIEDNSFNRILVRRILESEGFEVLEAESAGLGIEMAQQSQPDLILMDLSMPEMDGLEATREIRRKTGGEDVPIIGLTAHASKEDRDRCLGAGMDGYLTKPVNLEALDGIVEDVRQRSLIPV